MTVPLVFSTRACSWVSRPPLVPRSPGISWNPLLADINPVTGLGTVVGVIGGYQQGGSIPSVSYAARLGVNAAALYQAAIARP